MPYQAPITVKTALDRIRKHDYVLPAIQREFVWKPEQIYKLFDSLLQGFPVGSFLFWKIDPETSKTFEFFDFAREYHHVNRVVNFDYLSLLLICGKRAQGDTYAQPERDNTEDSLHSCSP